MKTSESIRVRRQKAVANGVSTLHPFIVDRARNSEVWDVEGKRYIDFAGGIGVLNVGHNHPDVVEAIKRQISHFLHTAFQVAAYEPYVELAELLIERAPGSFGKKAVFFNSGAEAVENAVKIARYATGRPGVITFSGGFHGRTLLTMGLTAKLNPYKFGFGPFPGNLFFADFPDSDTPQAISSALASLQEIFDRDIEPGRIAAIIIEPIQGEAGFRVAPFGFLQTLRDICDRHGIVLVADEIQSGFGRSGRWFSIEHSGIVPDLVTVAKSIGGGLPISGVAGRADLMDSVKPGGLGGTFGGNPLACAAGIAAIRVIEGENLLQRSNEIGTQIRRRFSRSDTPCLGAIRGLGGMIGIELVDERNPAGPNKALATALIVEARENGLLLITSGQHENVLRLLVPLTASPEIVEEGLDILETSLVQASRHIRTTATVQSRARSAT